jgi:hypothetical protein
MITVCGQLEAMTGIADALEEVAKALAETLERIAPDGYGELLLESEERTVEHVSFAKEAVLDELNALRALVTDLRHQEDTINTQRMRIRDMAALRKIHGFWETSGGAAVPDYLNARAIAANVGSESADPM